MKPITWLLEPLAFNKLYKSFEKEIRAAGHNVVYWDDKYTDSNAAPASLKFIEGPVVFHGSLGTAYHISRRWLLSPGTFGSLKPFECTSYYPKTLSWRLNQEYIASTVKDVCENHWLEKWEKELPLLRPDKVFIRPSSPMKQFSGRILNCKDITPKALDYGFYYNNLNLTIIIAPVKKIWHEWRFLVVGKNIITGCAYSPENRLYKEICR